MKLLIQNGVIVNSDKIIKGDVLIENEKIVKIASKIPVPAKARIIDASGKLVLPGAIDPHTHLDLPVGDGLHSCDDFKSGGIAAAFGGTTTVIDFATPEKGESLAKAVKIWKQKAKNSPIDYGFHLAIREWNSKIKKEISQISKWGITSIKCYMAYKNILQLSDEELLDVFKTCKKYKILPSVHAEDGDQISENVNELISHGYTEAKYHAISRSDDLESFAIKKAAAFAKIAKSPLYIVHLSSEKGLKECLKARAKGVKIIIETCPQYLLLNESEYEKDGDNGFEAAKFVCSPPLRSKKSNRTLIAATLKGQIDIIATDHCPFKYKGEKDSGAIKSKKKLPEFNKIPNGIPGIETRVPLMFTELVYKKKMKLTEFVALTSTNSAKIFGLSKSKGAIKSGYDADIVIMDYEKQGGFDVAYIITQNNQHSNCDYTTYEGFESKCKIEIVIQRGQFLIQDGKFMGKKKGKFLKRYL